MLKIRRIEIKNFGPFKEVDLDLSSLDKNFIKIQGSSGSGKTHLLLAIYFCLFGKKHLEKLVFPNIDFTSRTLKESPCQVCLHFVFNGVEVKLNRTLKVNSKTDLILEDCLFSQPPENDELEKLNQFMAKVLTVHRLTSDKGGQEQSGCKVSWELAALLNTSPEIKLSFEKKVSNYLELILVSKECKQRRLEDVNSLSFHIDNANTFLVKGKNKNQIISSQFSPGEMSLLYFCMELALYELVLGGSKFPILIDSPFEALESSLAKSFSMFLSGKNQQVICLANRYVEGKPDFYLCEERSKENGFIHSNLVSKHDYNPSTHHLYTSLIRSN